MWDTYWDGRGVPSEFDPGPAPAGRFAELFAHTPNYRGIGHAWSGKEEFRWHFGPMFYRGRLDVGAARVLVVGQEGAQDESLSHRSFTGGTGGRMQHLLTHLGITHSYLFLNTFVYPIFGQYDAGLRPLAQDHRSPIVVHRHAIFDHVVATHPTHLVIAVGTAAKESVATWIRSHGGTAEAAKLHEADATVVSPGLRAVGVLHPGGAGKGGSVTAIIAAFKAALAQIEMWAQSDPGWLPPDAGSVRSAPETFKYSSSPIPFRDLPFGVPWRLGFGSTSSNRRDGQNAIQLFSDDGRYNNQGQPLTYSALGGGSTDGYDDDPGDLPYEPPKVAFGGFDAGPPAPFATLLQGREPGLDWPDFHALGLGGHPSFGFGASYRGRLAGPSILVLADQASHDDLFFMRALCGDAGQHLQSFLRAAGLTRRYAIVRTLPVDSMTASSASVTAAADHPQVRAILRRVLSLAAPKVVLAVGAQASRIAGAVAPAGTAVVTMQAWGSTGTLADWRRALGDLASHQYPKDGPISTTWDGLREQIARIDLPFGMLRWQATSGDRAQQALRSGSPSPDYFKVALPAWAAGLGPSPLSPAEQAAIADLNAHP